MKLRITKVDIALVLFCAVLLSAAGVAMWWWKGWTGLAVLPVLAVMLLAVLLLEMYRTLIAELEDRQARMMQAIAESASRIGRAAAELREELKNHEDRRIRDYRQIESLFSLFFTLEPGMPLPDMRGWPTSPDLLKKVSEIILREKPLLVMEAGSGLSTLVIAYCLRKLGAGKVVSLEHSAEYAAASRDLIAVHGLEDVAVIAHVPLKEVGLKDGKWLWYDLDRVKIERPVDFLLVDGPPGDLQKLSRYPALPLLSSRLSDRATIIMDDGNRPEEKQVVEMWVREFGNLSSEYLDVEKGAYLLRKNDGIVAHGNKPVSSYGGNASRSA